MPIQTETVTKRYAETFRQLKTENKTALIPFTLLGWPNKTASLDIIKQMIDAGASALELGFAFSDPMADGPVIQQAAQQVLANQFTTEDAFSLLKQVREHSATIPIGLLVYYNMVLAYGIERWFESMQSIGVDAVMIVDLSLELLSELKPVAEKYNIDLVLMISPLTSKERMEEIAKHQPPFLYVVSRLGITGTHTNYDSQLDDLLKTIQSVTDIPACVGFGISEPAHITQMRQHGADGAIVGSAVIKTVDKALSEKKDPVTEIGNYIRSLASACQ